jgi:CP family cyanate transporter-like MFS transporter
MTPANRLRGRFLAFLAVILVSLSIRPAVSAVAPVITLMAKDIPLTAVTIGVLGLIAPVCYSVFGTASPWISSRITLEWTMVIAMVMLAAGQLIRSLVNTDLAFIFWSFVAIGGIGIANVLLPPLIRRFFPDRFAGMTALYSTILATATFLPSAITPAVAEVTGWREAIGMYCLLAVFALLPLVSLIVTAGTSRSSVNKELQKSVQLKVWTSPTSWAIAGAFAMSAFFAYTGMSWLPIVLHDRIGVTLVEAGTITAVFGATGLPANLVVPLLASKLRNPAWLYLVAGACGTSGALGFLLIPGTLTLLWAVLLGFSTLIFALNLYLLNQRTKSQEGTVVLSGMAQGVGYAVAASGPLMFGVLHQITDGWDAPLLMLVIAGFAFVPIWLILRQPVLVDE